MPSSGGGTGTPISGGAPQPAVAIPDAYPRSCVPLSRYAYLMNLDECAFWGVSTDTNAESDPCPIWTQQQRDSLANYLAEAQEEIEQVTRFPLCPTWFTAEQHTYRFPIHSRWTKVIAAGIEAETMLDEDAGLDYTVEPVAVVPITTTLTSTSEIKVFYPNSDREIIPYSMTISAGTLRIYIPRCRLVHPDELDNPSEGLDYNDLTNFLSAVDVKRVYNAASTHAELVWAHRDTVENCAACGCLTCGEHTETGCVYTINARTGALDIVRADYAAAVWTPTCSLCFSSRPDFVRVNYYAGMSPITKQAESAVIRLAHAKMPEEPCGCDLLKRVWARDTNVPDFVSRERDMNPFGVSDGAWNAWRFANAMTTRRVGVL